MPSLRQIARFAPSLLVVVALTGSCSKQDEGDRCDVLNNSEDCASGLVCVAASELLRSEADRCCPPEGDRISDSRCRRSVGGITGTGGAGGLAATGGAAGASQTAGSAGDLVTGGDGGARAAVCEYKSDCPTGQTCGLAGVCQPECKTDRDCFPGQSCSDDGACIANAASGGAPATGGAPAGGNASGGSGGTAGSAPLAGRSGSGS